MSFLLDNQGKGMIDLTVALVSLIVAITLQWSAIYR